MCLHSQRRQIADFMKHEQWAIMLKHDKTASIVKPTKVWIPVKWAGSSVCRCKFLFTDLVTVYSSPPRAKCVWKNRRNWKGIFEVCKFWLSVSMALEKRSNISLKITKGGTYSTHWKPLLDGKSASAQYTPLGHINANQHIPSGWQPQTPAAYKERNVEKWKTPTQTKFRAEKGGGVNGWR